MIQPFISLFCAIVMSVQSQATYFLIEGLMDSFTSQSIELFGNLLMCVTRVSKFKMSSVTFINDIFLSFLLTSPASSS